MPRSRGWRGLYEAPVLLEVLRAAGCGISEPAAAGQGKVFQPLLLQLSPRRHASMVEFRHHCIRAALVRMPLSGKPSIMLLDHRKAHMRLAVEFKDLAPWPFMLWRRKRQKSREHFRDRRDAVARDRTCRLDMRSDCRNIVSYAVVGIAGHAVWPPRELKIDGNAPRVGLRVAGRRGAIRYSS